MFKTITAHCKKLDAKRHIWRDHLKDKPLRFTLYKAAIVAVGVIIMLAGLVMLVTPGPGLVVIFAGLTVLATEIPWAHRIVRIIKLHVKRIIRKFRRKPARNITPRRLEQTV